MHSNDLKYQIERILRWEPSEHWRPRDFMHLSERVMAYTNQWVEAQDLQQFWRSSDWATPALLDALAQFADYRDWDDFCTRNQVGTMAPADEPNVFHQPAWEIPTRWVVVIGWVSIVASVVVCALLIWKR